MSLPQPAIAEFIERLQNAVNHLCLITMMEKDKSHKIQRDARNPNVFDVESSYGLARLERTERSLTIDIAPNLARVPHLDAITIIIPNSNIPDSILFDERNPLTSLVLTVVAQSLIDVIPNSELEVHADLPPARGHIMGKQRPIPSEVYHYITLIAQAITSNLADGDVFTMQLPTLGATGSIGIISESHGTITTERYLKSELGPFIQQLLPYCEHLPCGIAIFPAPDNDAVFYVDSVIEKYVPESPARVPLDQISDLFVKLKKLYKEASIYGN